MGNNAVKITYSGSLKILDDIQELKKTNIQVGADPSYRLKDKVFDSVFSFKHDISQLFPLLHPLAEEEEEGREYTEEDKENIYSYLESRWKYLERTTSGLLSGNLRQQIADIVKHGIESGEKPSTYLDKAGKHLQHAVEDVILKIRTPVLTTKRIARKGHDKPLIGTGQFLQSITYVIAKAEKAVPYNPDDPYNEGLPF